MAALYNIYLVYGGNRSKPIIVEKRNIVGSNSEDVKIKSGIMKEIQTDWDTEFVTIIIEKIGDVVLREKTKKVVVEKEND